MKNAVIGKRGLQVKRKDKDQMSDTGGASKGRGREPHSKPPRDDLKNRYRTKRKTKENRDKDNDNDPDMKKGSVHPLDRKIDFLGFPSPEDNYYRSVWGCLVDIFATERGISEKSFFEYDELMSEVDYILRNSTVMMDVDKCEQDGLRASFCSEIIYRYLQRFSNGCRKDG